jgi:alkylhydroperoxidase family enzyme
MRLKKPRLDPISDEEMGAEQQELLGPLAKSGSVHNVFRTLIRYPKLFKRWNIFANHVLNKSSLPPREREIIILRIGWLCQAGYEWGQHARIGRNAGLTDAEIKMIAEGPGAAGWSDNDVALLNATDELHADAFISDKTWAQLQSFLSDEQCMDVVFAVGQYNLVSMALNTFGVQLDEGLEQMPAR